MSDQSHDERRLSLFCQKNEDTWKIVVGPGWVPFQLRPFLDTDFESGPLLLDFEYLEESLKKRGALCETRVSKLGDKELIAHGQDTKVLASWLGTALASGLAEVKR